MEFPYFIVGASSGSCTLACLCAAVVGSGASLFLVAVGTLSILAQWGMYTAALRPWGGAFVTAHAHAQRVGPHPTLYPTAIPCGCG